MSNPPGILRRAARRWPLLSSVLLGAALLSLIPFGDPPQRMADGLVVAELALFALVALWSVLGDQTSSPPGSAATGRYTDAVLGLALYGPWLWLWLPRITATRPVLDDVIYLRTATEPSLTGLFEPHNEHCVFLPKLFTTAAVQIAAAAGVEPTVLGRSGLFLMFFLAAARAMRVATGSVPATAAGLAFLAFVPATTEAVCWYSASLWLIGPVLFLFALPDAYHGRRPWLVAAAAALGPFAFWSGALVGPGLAGAAWAGTATGCRGSQPVRRTALFALAGTVTGTLLCMLIAARGQRHLAWHSLANLTVWERATVFSGRFLADHAFGGLPAVSEEHLGPFAYPLRLAAVLVGLVCLLALSRPRRLVGVLVGVAAASYAMSFLARADLAYELALRHSDRYHIWGHLAVSWLVAGAVAGGTQVVSRWLTARRSLQVASARSP